MNFHSILIDNVGAGGGGGEHIIIILLFVTDLELGRVPVCGAQQSKPKSAIKEVRNRSTTRRRSREDESTMITPNQFSIRIGSELIAHFCHPNRLNKMI